MSRYSSYEHDRYTGEAWGEPEGGGYVSGSFGGTFWADDTGIEMEEVYWEDDIDGYCEFDTYGESYGYDLDGDEEPILDILDELCVNYLTNLNVEDGYYKIEGKGEVNVDAGGISEYSKPNRRLRETESYFDGTPSYSRSKDYDSKIEDVKITKLKDKDW